MARRLIASNWRQTAAQVQVSVRPREGTKALIYFGGNAEDVSASLAPIAAAFPDRSVFLMHYRGYGGSTGSPTERALHADARVLFDLLSMTQKISWSSDAASGLGLRCAWRLSGLCRERDEVIPRSSTDQLFTRFSPGIAKLDVVPGTGHNTVSDAPTYYELLKGAR